MKLNFFDLWNAIKQKVNKGKKIPYFKVGEIRWIQMGQNVGSEIFGKGELFQRPALILKVVFGNSAIIIPLTSKVQKGSYYMNFKDRDGKIQYALFAQIKYVDGRRIRDKLSSVDILTLKNIKKKFITFIEV